MAHVLPAHNETLIGDTLYSVSLNYQWRRLVAEAIEAYFDRLYPELKADDDQWTLYNQVSALILDLYNNEVIPPMAIRAARYERHTDQTIPANTLTAVEWSNHLSLSRFEYDTFTTPIKNGVSVFQIPEAGKYHVNVSIRHTLANGYTSLELWSGGIGTGVLISAAWQFNNTLTYNLACDCNISQGDLLQVAVNSGVATTLQGSREREQWFSIHKIN